jgi:tetratricopeptide (TPR) repeat protein
MTLVGQQPPSAALLEGFELLTRGKTDEAEEVVKKAAREAKKNHGSGSHPLALAYGELGQLHLRVGRFERAAKEFQHAAEGPLPAERERRLARLSFLFGYGAALGELNRLAESETVLRKCIAFARNVAGATSALAAVAQVPLADVLLRAGKTHEAAKLAETAYDELWKLGDPLFASSVGTRAEARRAIGQTNNPFTDLADLPEDLIAAAAARTQDRAGKGDFGRVRAVLADLLAFVEKRYGEGHALTGDTLAAIAHHEAAAGARADERVHRTAVRRLVWSYAVTRVPGGLLANLEVGFEPGGEIHLAPHLSREPSPGEAAEIEAVLNRAVDDLFARPAIRP